MLSMKKYPSNNHSLTWAFTIISCLEFAQYFKNKTISNVVTSFVIFLSFMWLYYVLQGEFWWGSLIPSIFGTIVFSTIEYLTSASGCSSGRS